MKKNIRVAAIAGVVTFGLFTAGQADAATPTCNVKVSKQTQHVQYINADLAKKYKIKFKHPSAQAKAPAKAPAAKVAAPAPQAAPAPAAQPAPQQTEAKPQPAQQQQTAGSVSAFEQQVFELVNQERAKQGVKPLQLDTKLSDVARAKSKDMKDKGYFSHQSPTYGSPFDMMKQFGITYKTAGENIAKGQQTPEEVMKAWMNSDGHRKNILSADFTHIGVGYVDGHWTQMFIGK
ncbi:CAP domain-containing protein [Domibacillus epiphyticus]|uniref:SCP domain-containing protein n=1 Tax=Domibacillus epiphyticus TaxID=1714355 RepID=A0A1V2A6Y8_9BACI|nr:CAP domain-containing protein [Domibacillus epiphyticus]OMP66758.1 hypothetical protein BTO28_10685 [Domibacillus epiphyticus]